MARWCKDGVALDDEALAGVGLSDGDAIYEFGGVQFRVTVETVAPRQSSRDHCHAEAVVLRLRELGTRPEHAIHLYDYIALDQIDAIACGSDPLFDEAGETASRAVRRYVGAELFRRAEELVTAA